MAERALIDRAELAKSLGITVGLFYRRYAQLRAHEINPLPGPVLGRMRGERWDPQAIAAWIAAGGEHATHPPTVAASALAPGEAVDWATRLDARAIALADEED